MPSSTKYAVTHPHLMETNRIELACDYLIHEFRKIFPELTETEARQRVRRYAPDEARDDRTIRDFWNLFCAMSSTWRLKDLYNIVTNPGIAWRKSEVAVENLYPESPFRWAADVKSKSDFFNESVILLRQNPDRLIESLLLSEKEQQKQPNGSEDDPIIAVKDDNGYQVRDGNRRLIYTIERYVSGGDNLQAPRIMAWLGDGSGNKNYWMPTNSLCFLRDYIFTYAQEQIVIEEKLRNYPLARIEYRKRCTRDILEEE